MCIRDRLLNRLVPPLVLEWLAADPALMRELVAFLSGDDSAPTGAISELVLRAAGQSPSRDLRPRGRGDTKVQEVVPAANPTGVKAEGDVEDPATTSTTTVAMDQPALPVEETEYLEGVDDDQPKSASLPSRKSMTSDSAGPQAPDGAHRFMAWLQQGLADGTLPVNVAGALVHFVPEDVYKRQVPVVPARAEPAARVRTRARVVFKAVLLRVLLIAWISSGWGG